MIARTCSAVRRYLSAFHDGELAISEQVSVQNHLRECPACAAESASLQAVGDMLRETLAPSGDLREELAGLAPSVVSRLKVEREESLGGWIGRAFDDLHLVWAGLGAAGATVACVAIMVGMFHLGVRERPDSLSALLAALASPGSDANPMSADYQMALPQLPPSLYPDEVLPASVLNGDQETMITLSAVVTREGRVQNLDLLSADNTSRQNTMDLLDSASRVRFKPARYGNSPVAVNMVWMLAHLTVKAKLSDSSLLILNPGPSILPRAPAQAAVSA